MYKIVSFLFILISFSATAQPISYSVQNAHSHNDYVNAVPFWTAYNEGFGSIEADIFLKDKSLLVAHDAKELTVTRSLINLYINPLIECLIKHNGYPFADTLKQLQLLIDIKTDSIATLQALVETIRKYDVLMNSHQLKWVITGKRPEQSLFAAYPSFITFDGELDKTYSPGALTKIAMLSDDGRKYTKWDGIGKLPAADLEKIKTAGVKAHKLHKPVRFWAVPDMIHAWNQFMQLKIDYINTDHIHELAAWVLLKSNPYKD